MSHLVPGLTERQNKKYVAQKWLGGRCFKTYIYFHKGNTQAYILTTYGWVTVYYELYRDTLHYDKLWEYIVDIVSSWSVKALWPWITPSLKQGQIDFKTLFTLGINFRSLWSDRHLIRMFTLAFFSCSICVQTVISSTRSIWMFKSGWWAQEQSWHSLAVMFHDERL